MNALAADLDRVLLQTGQIWESLRGQRLFLTGGTGFFGSWLLETFTWAHDRLALDASVTVLTRSASAFRKKAPHLALHPAVQLCEGDVRTGLFPRQPFSHIIHAATQASAELNSNDPALMLDTIVAGTRRMLEFACEAGAARFLFTSSGAVYGPQPRGMSHVAEDFGTRNRPDAHGAYGKGKRAAEDLCGIFAAHHGIQATIARGFAFIGPYLPLDAHFAAGNFIGNAVRGEPIHVSGDGTPYRSYLYATDLATWLWTILLKGEVMRPYNVGSAEAVTITQLAHMVAGSVTPPVPVSIARPGAEGAPANRYVPSVTRAETELGLRQTVNLENAIARTIEWHLNVRTPRRVTHS